MDRLKSINDRLGHEHGDPAIRAAAQALRATFRDSDLVARLGEDGFAPPAAKAATDTAAVMTERLRANLREGGAAEGEVFTNGTSLTCSVRVAPFVPEQRSSLDDLFDEADRSMYQEKRRKPNLRG